ncbi:MAG: ABC transporter ATP-binding protein, partial [Lachnospira sp.]|nr:ABC transporter ATP-binding protein [Lachnospira sp.]
MGRIIKSVAPYWKSALMIIVLLFLQAYCDLALPQYTSDIIDTGIQNGGISHVMPEAIVEEEYYFAKVFMTEDERAIWDGSYDKDGNIYKLNVTDEKKLNEYDEKLVLPLLIIHQMTDEQKTQLKGYLFQLNSESGGVSAGTPMDAIRGEAKKTIDTMGSSLVKSMGVAYAKAQDEKAGLDMEAIQTKYLVVAGLKMLSMALLMAAVAIAIGFLAARIGAGIGRDLRGKVYTKVMSFSNTEMDKFSTASLITRTTNDVQQIQMVSVMMLRMVCYAPIIGIGGILKVRETGAGMDWIIALSVGSILVQVLSLIAIAIPNFKLMQKLVDAVKLVSRDII